MNQCGSMSSSFKENIFREIEFVREAPVNIPLYSWRDFPYKPIPYKGKDLLIDGYFQSYKYVDTDLLRQLYAMPEEIGNNLKQKYRDVLKRFFYLHSCTSGRLSQVTSSF